MLQRRPVAGRDYSGSYVDLLRRFSNDIACLCWLRWSEGLHCPRCTSTIRWRLTDGRWSRVGCAL